MPDKEKVVSKLTADELIEELDYCGYDPYYDLTRKPIVDEIHRRLKEQEPVKPVQHLVYTTKGWFCGACDRRLNRLGKYCSFCGRPVKWE